MKYRPEIDGLRALAVVPVILFHAGFELFGGGFVGVDVFFVISGYLITTIIHNDISADKFSFVSFYERRARRILPALMFMMAACIPVAWATMMSFDMWDFGQSLVAVSLFLSNVLFWAESGYFDQIAELKPLLHTWSLAVEEQFYVLFPILLLALTRFWKNKVFVTLLVLLVLSLAAAEYGSYYFPEAAFYFLPTRAWELLIGAVVALHLLERERDEVSSNIQNLLGLLGLVLIAGSVFLIDKSDRFPGLIALFPTIGTALIIVFAREDTVAGRILSQRVLVFVGLISYSSYLWHQPIFAFLRMNVLEEPSTLLMTALSVVSLFIGYLSWRFVESPFRNRQWIPRKPLFSALFVATVFFVGFGYPVHKLHGNLPFMNKDMLAREAVVQELVADRMEITRNGVCDDTRAVTPEDVSAFARNCFQNRNLVVFGDSHAADRASALRLAGVKFSQLTSGGCRLVPGLVTAKRPICRNHYDLLEDLRGADTVVLANRFKLTDISVEEIQAIAEFWSSRFEQVILFTPTPDFNAPYKEYLRFGTSRSKPSGKRETKFQSVLGDLVLPANFTIINSRQMLCIGLLGNCFTDDSGQLLLTDYGHLSRTGAERFGRNLIELEAFERILPNE